MVAASGRLRTTGLMESVRMNHLEGMLWREGSQQEGQGPVWGGMTASYCGSHVRSIFLFSSDQNGARRLFKRGPLLTALSAEAVALALKKLHQDLWKAQQARVCPLLSSFLFLTSPEMLKQTGNMEEDGSKGAAHPELCLCHSACRLLPGRCN